MTTPPKSNKQSSNMIQDMMRANGDFKQAIIYDATTRFIPGLLSGIARAVSGRFQRRAQRMCNDVMRRAACNKDEVRVRVGSIVIERNYKVAGEHNDMFDAVLALASDLPQARFVKRTARGVFIVETDKEIKLTPDISFMKLRALEVEGEIEKMSIDVFSHTQDIVQLRTYLIDVEALYMKSKKNQLGRQLFYFDELPVIPPMGPVIGALSNSMAPDLSKSPSLLTFTMFPLHTNKSLKNIYGSSVKKAKKRIDFFLSNPAWYREKGIPYTLGILLHGAPGCGKTSFIKGLAQDTGRHVINFKLSKYTTISQINNLFYSSRISVVRDGASATHDIPIDKRIIVMEDIDCLSDVVLDRSATAGQGHVGQEMASQQQSQHQLNLAVLLNILDGVLETPGRIVIMTSNEPWKLDSALVRPGRIDISIEFQKCTSDDIMDMVHGICGIQIDRAAASQYLLEDVWTPAEVTKVIFENLDEPLHALEIFKDYPKDNRGDMKSRLKARDETAVHSHNNRNNRNIRDIRDMDETNEYEFNRTNQELDKMKITVQGWEDARNADIAQAQAKSREDRVAIIDLAEASREDKAKKDAATLFADAKRQAEASREDKAKKDAATVFADKLVLEREDFVNNGSKVSKIDWPAGGKEEAAIYNQAASRSAEIMADQINRAGTGGYNTDIAKKNNDVLCNDLLRSTPANDAPSGPIDFTKPASKEMFQPWMTTAADNHMPLNSAYSLFADMPGINETGTATTATTEVR